MPAAATSRPRSTLLAILLLWLAFYASFTLVAPPLLDDADSVHAEVAREMLLRHDYVTLYANGIRYLEKAPLLYWSMALSFRLFGVSAAAARIPLALTVLALALLTEAFARRIFRSPRAGLYAALILLGSPGIFLFTRITIPDAMVCLWLTLALYAFWQTEAKDLSENGSRHRACFTFAAACALNTLTKGLIGLVFPVAIVAIYLLLTRGLRGSLERLKHLHPWTSFAVFLAIAAPWHVLAGLANPTQGHPLPITFAQGHWQVPLPTDGNVHGWFWFYFMNEHLLRYLNLRVPHDYDTSPLWLFWGLCLVWLMPWSAFVFQAAQPRQWLNAVRAKAPNADLLLAVWAAFVLLFFSLSTRQEYYVLPALPAIAILLAGWMARESGLVGSAADNLKEGPDIPSAAKAAQQGGGLAAGLKSRPFKTSKASFPQNRSGRDGRTSGATAAALLILGATAAAACLFFALRGRAPAPGTDLATLLQQNPADYALSLGHFLDLNAAAMGAFRVPLTIAAIALFSGPLANLLLRRRLRPHAANLALAAGAFGFLLAAHLGLQTFAPVLTSQQLAAAIAPHLQPNDLVVIHGEYEAGSTLGFYLRRSDIHILEGRSSNLWYGSFFPDAPPIFETPQTIAAKWAGPQRIFLWQDPHDQERPPLHLTPTYVIAQSGGKQILSNQP